MKKYIYLLAIVLTPLSLLSQTYVNAYDAYDAFYEPGGSYYSNADNYLGAVEPNFLKSFLYMFKATKDIKYVNEFAINAKRVMERRDDNINNLKTIFV